MRTPDSIPCLPTTPFLVTEKDMREMHQAALEVIATIGLEVRNEQWREKLRNAGGKLSASRVTFPQEMVEGFLREWRELFNMPEPGWGTSPGPQPRPDCIQGSVCMGYIQHMDLETDEIHPVTSHDCIKYIQFVNNFKDDNVAPGVPGLPNDVPALLQPLAQYKLGAQYSPAGGCYGWLSPPSAAEYLFRMADLMADPIDRTTVYNPTPLRLGGVELDVVLAFPERFKSVAVCTCIVAGSVGPIYPKASAALGIAENLAAAIAVRVLTGLPVDWWLRVDAFDLRSTITIYGSPEMILFHRMSEQVNAYYRGWFPVGGTHYLFTTAKVPGIQAAVDKAAGAGYAIACGCTHLGALGTIYLEQVFSPEQLVIDLEIRDWVQRLVRGVNAESERPEEWVEMIRRGVEAGSFLASDWTLDHYREIYWLPKLLDRAALGSWLRNPADRIRDRAKQMARERMVESAFRLPEPRSSQLEEIYEEAQRKLCRA